MRRTACRAASRPRPRSRRLASHIAWDPGAAEVARALAEQLAAPLVTSGYSRLVIDCNRPLASEGSIAATSDGIVVPGNQSIDAAERARRASTLFHPYHHAIADVLDQPRSPTDGRACCSASTASRRCWTVSRRPWQVGFAYGRDPGWRCCCSKRSPADGGLVVGHNQPYDVDDSIDYTIPVHGEQRGLPHVLIEIRQDLLTTPTARAQWAARLAAAYRRSEPSLLS